jgi:hypothetical protein
MPGNTRKRLLIFHFGIRKGCERGLQVKNTLGFPPILLMPILLLCRHKVQFTTNSPTDSMARYYVRRGKYSGALTWCNVALKAETDLTCLAVWSLHAAFVLSHLNRHQDALLTLKGAFKVLDWVRADTLKSLSDEERREIASEFDRSSNVSLHEPRQEIMKEAETSTMSWRIEEASKERTTSESLGNRTAKTSSKIERDVMQNVWLLEIITQLNTSIEYLHVFRCDESLRLARRAAGALRHHLLESGP